MMVLAGARLQQSCSTGAKRSPGGKTAKRLLVPQGSIRSRFTMTQDSAKQMAPQSAATDADALALAADEKRNDAQWVEAAELYTAVLKARPDAWPLMVQRGHCLKESGRVREALASYREAEHHAPDDSDLHLQIGHAHKILGDWQEAALAYARAVSLDPGNVDAWRESSSTAEWLVRHPDTDVTADELLSTEFPGALERPDPPAFHQDSAPVLAGSLVSSRVQMVLDVTDLLDYFNSSRTPTGIQRVQLGIVSRAIEESSESRVDLCFAAYDAGDLSWHQVATKGFTELTTLAARGSDTEDPVWVYTRDTLRQHVAHAPAFAFREGALLVNLGNSWGFPDYFRALRAAQHVYGVRYIPFIHDCVPLIVPEHCLLTMVQDYSRWFGAIGLHAHGILCNSENTKRDVLQQLDRLLPGQTLPIHVIRLDGDPRSVAAIPEDASLAALRALRPGEPYCLFVATIESRKDHLLVFQAWLQLVRRHGPSKVPRLVCVGKAGWHSEAALSLLQNAPELQRHVVLLSRVSDQELDALYDQCLFTVYNSHYEGWGLPITEALAHGKVVLTPRHSALAEAGGEAALYFVPQSQPDLQHKLEQLMFDRDFRMAQEAIVRDKGRPRSWSEIKDQTLAAVLELAEHPRQPLAARKTVNLGQQYRTQRLLRTRPDVALALAEAVRDGLSWHPVEEWGVWCRSGAAILRIPLPPAALGTPLRLYLELRSPPVAVTIPVRCHSANAAVAHFDVSLEAGGDNTFMLDLPPIAEGNLLEIELDNGNGIDLPALGLPDPRRIGLGLRSFMLCRLDDYAARLGFLEQQTLQQAST
ncbi:glycosyltransferase [Pseudoroseomonas globiformis]|uniref:Glycosyltransferase n=1 Tax=Teichococcus globiformis TaxID=2307229 RepID=A0ABV7FZD9_9PROT